jgi:predicted MPP superfamily phosphohydrolase
MKRAIPSITIALLLAVFLGTCVRAADDVRIRDIKSPTYSAPAFTLPGGSITVTLAASAQGTANKASLKSLAGEAVADVGLGEAPMAAGLNTFDVLIPPPVETGLYDLCIEFTAGGAKSTDCQPHAVAVVASFDPPFTFVQITDYHMGDPRALGQFPGVDIEKVRIKALETANSVNPAFVIFTGDICAYPETYEQDYPAAVQEIVSHIKVPTVIIPGNHDLYAKTDMNGKLEVEGLDYWSAFMGATHQILDYGKLRFIGFNTYAWPQGARNRNRPYHAQVGTLHTYQGAIDKAEMDWIIAQLKTLDGRTPIFFAHHGPRTFEVMPQQFGCNDCVSQTKMMKFLEKAGAPYYIYGHIHRNDDVTENGTEFIATTSVGSDVSEDQLWAIRVFHVKEDLTMESEVIKLFETPPMK